MKTAVATAIALAATATALTPSAAHAEEPTRILIVGDSVTHGYAGDYTWRYFAWNELAQAGAAVDFVGHRTGTNGGDGGAALEGPYADADFDTDHASRWGMAMKEMLDSPDALSPAIGDLVAAHAPDVIVEQLGVNDFARENLTAAEMHEQTRRFVADARAVNAGVDVVLGSIPQTWIREVDAYNAALPGLAAELSTEASRVVATPIADFVNGVDTYDFAHPTTSGQEKLAAAVTAGLKAVGAVAAPPLPEPAPATVSPVTPDSPAVSIRAPRRVKAVDRGARIVVKWASARTADRHAVRCGRSTRVTRGSRVVLRSGAARCQVQAVNDEATSRWVRARVRR